MSIDDIMTLTREWTGVAMIIQRANDITRVTLASVDQGLISHTSKTSAQAIDDLYVSVKIAVECRNNSNSLVK